MEDDILLSSKGLSVGYTDGKNINTLFSDLTVDLKRGQLVCFMGPNGIGKSTLIRTLAGLQDPLSGEITLNLHADLNVPEEISVVLTDKVSALNMTVQELVQYGRYPYLDWNIKISKADQKIITQAIELTRIQHLLHKKLFELSDGQLQMATIARALAQDTPIILLDEPTAHLDLNNRVEIMNLLRTLSRTTSKAILVATHELDLALQTADFIWLAGANKKILTGIPEDLVLNGSFDEIFQFKGFDLRTGKVSHEAYRNITIDLVGDGYEFLWTKNALERSGYKIDNTSPLSVRISKNNNQLIWYLGTQEYYSLDSLLRHLPH